jgi:GNAT superfamily N-acetyltransferase
MNVNANPATHIAETKRSFSGKSGKACALTIKRCGPDHYAEILSLQRRVYESIPDKNTFVMTTEEELRESLLDDVCLGAFDGGRLVAFTLMVANRETPRNLGNYLNYSPQERARCVTYDTTFIDPAYHGYGLQRFFIAQKDEIAISLRAREALATVSPDNAYSLRNLRANGFQVASEQEMYGGVTRFVLRKKLSETQDDVN